MNPAEKILRRMRATKIGWKPADFDRLYRGFGFEKVEGTSHTIYLHRKAGLRATVARHPQLASGYAAEAVKIIDEYKAWTESGKGHDGESEQDEQSDA